MSETTPASHRDQRPAPPESAKQRARRIPLDYYKGLTRLDALKWLLTLAATVVAGGYVLWTLLFWAAGSQPAARQFSPAPVASVHAAWDGKCAVCHVPGTGLRQDGQAISLASAILSGRGAVDHAASDARCQACHAGPAHRSNQIASEVWLCAGCHREHQGHIADLTRMADTACTRCHSDIAWHRDGPPKLAGDSVNVTSFAADHPPFRSLRERNPGHLRFNHRLHMLPGQYAAGAKDSGRQSPVNQLTCAHCHELDAGEVPAAGAYMQPIDYERHCAACHNGDLMAEVAGDGTTATYRLPHRLGPAAIGQILASLANPPTGRMDFSPESPLQPIPGKTPGSNLAQTTEPEAVARIAAAEHELRGGHRCGKCHEFQDRDTPPLAVAPPAVPSVWLAHGRFDHSAHRAMQCFDCHDRERLVTDSQDKPSLDERRPILPDIDNCRRCHAPATAAGTAGARHDCAECHRYHGGDLLPHGRGAAHRGVPSDRRLDGLKWISGQRSP